jgi:hypothetical protein
VLLPPPIVVVVIIIIILSVRQTKSRLSQSGVFCLSFVSFFSCFVSVKIRLSLVVFLSHVFCFSSLFFFFFLFSVSVKIRLSVHQIKSDETVGISRISSKILAATHLGATFIIIRRRRRLVVVFLSLRNDDLTR